MGTISTCFGINEMRHLCKKAWPFKTKITSFNDKDHDDFIRSHPDVKIMILERHASWSDYKKEHHYDVYFQKESDLILYKLCV